MSQKEVLIGESGRKQKAFKLPHVKCAEKKSCKGEPHRSSCCSSAKEYPPVLPWERKCFSENKIAELKARQIEEEKPPSII